MSQTSPETRLSKGMRSQPVRLRLLMWKLTAILSLLSGCVSKPAAEPKPPTAPGTSHPLVYPVLLVDSHRMHVRPSEERLTSSTVASGLAYKEYALIDATGARFSITGVTEFGRKSVILDMGTSRFRLYLQLKPEGTLSLSQAIQLTKATAMADSSITDKPAAARALDAAPSIPALITLAAEPWVWR